MPELPEVETVCSGLQELVVGQTIRRFIARTERLRWPIPTELKDILPGQVVRSIRRRAKYLLLEVDTGTILIHLGMSGVLRVVAAGTPLVPHDHVDLVFEDGSILRLNDPRRFGAWLWWQGEIGSHPRLRHLGPEPLADALDAEYLHALSRNRILAVKNLIMDQQVVVGVGNIYACEALFRARIAPQTPARKVSLHRYQQLVAAIKAVLQEAITQGGTTIRDFSGSDGKPGYFVQRLQVYGREEQPCVVCQKPIRNRRLGGRSSFYCPHCQKA